MIKITFWPTIFWFVVENLHYQFVILTSLFLMFKMLSVLILKFPNRVFSLAINLIFKYIQLQISLLQDVR